MNEVKKKLVILNTTIMLGLGSVFAIPSVGAESLQNQKTNIQKQRSDVQSNITKAEQELTAILEELAQLNAQIKRVDQAIIDNNNLIAQTKANITSTKAEIDELNKEISVIQDRMDKRNEILKQRAISYQENGNSLGFVEVLLGSKSFADFIERVGAVTKLVEADQEILAQHDADKKELEKKEASIEKKLVDLQDMKTELEGMRAMMEEQKQQNDNLKQQLEAKKKETASLKAELQMEDSTLAAKEKEIQKKMESNLRSQNSVATSGSSKGSQNSSAEVPTNGNNVAPSGDINTIITAGYKYIGNSVYVFGGGRTQSDIANGRFDCSGFVSWAFAQGGINLPASTSALRTQGTKISPSDMRPGDLVFFDTYKKDGHVGIYVGGGQFIGSQNSTGVAIANMSSGYWKDHFNGHVRRI